MNIAIKGILVSSLSACLSACAIESGEVADWEGEGEDLTTVEQPMQNATLVDVSGAVVEFRNSAGKLCTATLINNNALVTAAHCGTQNSSYYGNIKVLYQQNSTTWRCLTGTGAGGATITGSHASVLSNCPSAYAGFGSMLDYDSGTISYPGNDPGETWVAFLHDFAVVKVTAAGFNWVGTNANNYAAFYTGSISNGNEWAYGVGRSSAGSLDYRVRRDTYYVGYNDTYNIGAFGANAQLCSGDSGGPLGVFLPGSNRFAVVGVASVVPEPDSPTPPYCGIVNGATYWANATTRIWYVETALSKTCRSVNHGGVIAKECWD